MGVLSSGISHHSLLVEDMPKKRRTLWYMKENMLNENEVYIAPTQHVHLLEVGTRE